MAAEPYEVRSSDVGSQIAKLKASGANVFCIFATPTFAIQAYVFANRLGWKPLVINNAVSGTSNIMVLASEGGKNKLVEGTITTTVLKDPTDPRWNKDAGMKLYRSLLAKYAKGANPNDVYHVYGMAVGYETVSLLQRLGAESDSCGADGAGALDLEREEPVPAARRRREDRQGRQLPDPAGTAPALDEGQVRPRRRALGVEAQLAPDREQLLAQTSATVSTSTATPGLCGTRPASSSASSRLAHRRRRSRRRPPSSRRTGRR